MCLFSVKGLQGEDGLLAQALEGWVLQQAVTGLKQSGQYDQAETLCSQVRTHMHTLCFCVTLSPIDSSLLSSRAQVQTQTDSRASEQNIAPVSWHHLSSIHLWLSYAQNTSCSALGVSVVQGCPILLLKDQNSVELLQLTPKHN